MKFVARGKWVLVRFTSRGRMSLVEFGGAATATPDRIAVRTIVGNMFNLIMSMYISNSATGK